MPKLYEYFGLAVLFYSNEHEPIHVHGKYQNMESKAEFIFQGSEIVEIRFSEVKGKKPLPLGQLKQFQAVVETYSAEIVKMWWDYFVWHMPIESQQITRRLR